MRGTRDAHRLTVAASSERFDVSAAARRRTRRRQHVARHRHAVRRVAAACRSRSAARTPVVASAERVEVGAARAARSTEGARRPRTAGRTATDDSRRPAAPADSRCRCVGTFSREFNQRVATTLKFGGAWDLRIGDTDRRQRPRCSASRATCRFLTEPKFDVDPEKLEVDADHRRGPGRRRRSSAIGRGPRPHRRASVDTRLSEARRAVGPRRRRAARAEERHRHPRPALARAAVRACPDSTCYGCAEGRGDRARARSARPLLAGHASGDAIGMRWPDQGLNARDGRRRPRLRRRPRGAEAGHAGGRRRHARRARRAAARRPQGGGHARRQVRQVRGGVAHRPDDGRVGHRLDALRRDRRRRRSPTSRPIADRCSWPSARGPTLSTDIVIVGREQDEDVGARRRRRCASTCKLRHGRRLQGQGLRLRRQARRQRSASPAPAPTCGRSARSRVREGTYEGYGQNLTITRGNLVFSGPIDNPALDIVAVRKNLAVEAGVQISGHGARAAGEADVDAERAGHREAVVARARPRARRRRTSPTTGC